MPRVITGKFRGTILNAPKGDATRPTTDKGKETLFNSLGQFFDGGVGYSSQVKRELYLTPI